MCDIGKEGRPDTQGVCIEDVHAEVVGLGGLSDYGVSIKENLLTRTRAGVVAQQGLNLAISKTRTCVGKRAISCGRRMR